MGPANQTDAPDAKAAAVDLGKSVVSQAAQGAAQGAMLGGGVGAAVGAAKGAALGVLKDATGRKLIIIALVAFLTLTVGIPAVVVAATAQMVSQAAGGISASDSASSVASALADGSDEKDVRAAMELAQGHGIPWQVAAAVKKETGEDLDIKKAKESLLENDPRGVLRDLGAGARYSSSSNVRTVTGDSDKALAEKSKTMWVTVITFATGMSASRAKSVYTKATTWSLAQADEACATSPSVGGDSSSGAGSGAGFGSTSLSAQQVTNASIIIGISKSIWTTDADQRAGAVIGIITAMQESSLINIDYGDRDSIGLFQQRPSMGWGTVEQIMRPDYSSATFLTRMQTNLPEWRTLSPGVAAQKIQVSAFPDAYDKHVSVAQTIIAQRFILTMPVPVPTDVLFTGASQPSGGGESPASTGLCAALPGGDVQKPIYDFKATDGYGYRGKIAGIRTNPFHYAQDFQAKCGTKLYAVKAGTVTGSGALGTYGYRVKIDHGNSLSTLYAHMPADGPVVKFGDTVAAGQLIGRVGQSGSATGCHLHFETWQGATRVSPVPLMADLGVDILTPSPDPHAAG
jgi:murein DD-endopeptidase MepM/ murein hydrolase activator NlpD